MGSCLMHKWEDDDERIISQPKEKEVEGTMWVGEMILPDGCEFRDENGNAIQAQKIVMVKKQPQYPKTYEECCNSVGRLWQATPKYNAAVACGFNVKKFCELLVCRNAYWKFAGDWFPDWLHDDTKYVLFFNKGEICKEMAKHTSNILAFPTEEMRDAFYENFKELIKEVKEWL